MIYIAINKTHDDVITGAYIGLIGAVIGARLTYELNLRTNQMVLERKAKTFARYIRIILNQQSDILKDIDSNFLTTEIKKYCEDNSPISNDWRPKKYAVTELSCAISQDILEKILLSKNFEQSAEAQVSEVLDVLISAEDSFKKCICWINIFNDQLNERVDTGFEKHDYEDKIKDKAQYLLQIIYKAYKKAESNNNLAKTSFFDACKKLGWADN